MKIIALSDLHGNSFFTNGLKNDAAESDLIMISGDITNFGRRLQAEETLRPLLDLSIPMAAVAGNCDYPQVEDYLNDLGVNLSEETSLIKGFLCLGLNGSLRTPVPTPCTYTETQFEAIIAKKKADILYERPFIILSHQPPFDTAMDRTASGKHVGSAALRKFIEETSPLLCISGHIHESFGKEIFGRTVLLNPGPFHEGKYAIIDVTEGAVDVCFRSVR